MTTTPLRATHLTTSAVCPTWCEGHDDLGWCSLHRDPETGRTHRQHGSPYEVVEGDLGVHLLVEEVSGVLLPAEVVVFTAHEDERLTPAAARRLALALLRAAEDAEAVHAPR